MKCLANTTIDCELVHRSVHVNPRGGLPITEQLSQALTRRNPLITSNTYSDGQSRVAATMQLAYCRTDIPRYTSHTCMYTHAAAPHAVFVYVNDLRVVEFETDLC